ncbi:MAG: NAD(P)-dependent oxidoreductase [bacterium]|nr:NAD(P)-dependent oxidoreductase [bacterium]
MFNMKHSKPRPGPGHVALLTGATGYVGSNLAGRLVADEWSVHAVARENSDLTHLSSIEHAVTVHRHDGSTEGMVRIFRDAEPEVVFHLAALATSGQHGQADAVPLLTSNVVFPTQVLEGVAAAGTKWIVNTGTFSQHYGDSDYDPTNLYASTKQAFESILFYC